MIVYAHSMYICTSMCILYVQCMHILREVVCNNYMYMYVLYYESARIRICLSVCLSSCLL